MTIRYLGSKWKPRIVVVVRAAFTSRDHNNAYFSRNAPRRPRSQSISRLAELCYETLTEVDARVSLRDAAVAEIAIHLCTTHYSNGCSQCLWYQPSLHAEQQHPYIIGYLKIFDGSAPSPSFALSYPVSETLSNRVASFLFLVRIFLLVLSRWASHLLDMGNEGSQPSSDNSTPASENQSLYSIHSRHRSSLESTRAPSPAEPPAPDLSHLTPDEIAQIRRVMERARSMQQDESCRLRKLEEEYMDLTADIERESSLTGMDEAEVLQCSVCSKTELTFDRVGSGSDMRVCVDCEKIACGECGAYNTSPSSSATPEWLCEVCENRRHMMMMTTGMWYNGCHGGSELSLERHIIGGTSDRSREADNQMTSALDTSMISCVSQASSKDSRTSREYSDHTPGSYSWDGSRCGGDSGLGMDLSSLSNASSQNSELARHVYEQNRVKGILLYMMGPCGPGATLPKSESDEFSDLASDLDFDEQTVEKTQPSEAGFGLEDFDRDLLSASVSSHRQAVASIVNLHCDAEASSVSISYDRKNTAMDVKDPSESTADEKSGLDGSQKKTAVESKSEPANTKPSWSIVLSDVTFSASLPSACGDDQNSKSLLSGTEFPLDTNCKDCLARRKVLGSHDDPTAILGWDESLRSVHSSSGLQDSCPGSLHDMNPSLQPGMAECSIVDSQATQTYMVISPDDFDVMFISGEECETLSPSEPVPCDADVQIQHTGFRISGSMPHSTPIMNLASLASTAAAETASLTSTDITPGNLIACSSCHLLGDVCNHGDADSSLTLSVPPAYRDSGTPSAGEVAAPQSVDPASKSVDVRSNTKQKARPPTMDWSPVIDLSPIMDVSPSVEEAEQQDMLAKWMEELERKRSREAAAEEDCDSERFCSSSKPFFSGKGAFSQMKSVIPPHPDNEYESCINQELGLIEAPSEFIGTLKRCGNFEDISRLGSDTSLSKNISELPAADSQEDIYDSDNDLSFFSCITRVQTLSEAGPAIRSTVSELHVPGEHSAGNLSEEQGTKELRDLESLITDEIHRIAEDMEYIVKSDIADARSMAPPKPKRQHQAGDILLSPIEIATSEKTLVSRSDLDKTSEQASANKNIDEGPWEKCSLEQEHLEKKKAKALRARPNPILVQHIEAEEQTASPHYKVMKSPPSPEMKVIQIEFSDSVPASPNSPDQEAYTFPSPVTPLSSDSSPPKPYSPSSPGSAFEEENYVIPSANIARPPSSISLHRISSPHDDDKSVNFLRIESSSHKGPQIVTSAIIQERLEKSVTGIDSESEKRKAPIVPPRKRIRHLEEKKVHDTTSPLYENTKDFHAAEYFHEPAKSTPSFHQDSESMASAKGGSTLENKAKNIAQFTDVVTYPVFGEFFSRPRSSSAPSTELQGLSERDQRFQTSLRSRSASAEQEQSSTSEATANVRAQIRAFEEHNTHKPRDVPAPQNKSSRGACHDGHVMTDKRADSGSSTSSSGSSANSFGEFGRSQDKESSKDGKKVRRKLPPIPAGDPGAASMSKSTRNRPPLVKRAEGIDQDDSEFVLDSGAAKRMTRSTGESTTEDDLEMAARPTITRNHSFSSTRRTHVLDSGRWASLDMEDPHLAADRDETVKIKSQVQRAATVGYGPKDETDEIIDSLISIYGIPCTEAMKSLKKRLQDELRRVTKDRKIKLEQLAEIRALQMQIGAFRLESDVYSRSRSLPEKSSASQYLQVDSQQDIRKRGSVPQQSSSTNPRSSPQLQPRRPRHKRQSSDPMKSKFSPIKEDKDIEADFQIRAQQSQNGQAVKYPAGDESKVDLLDSRSPRPDSVRDARYSKIKPADYARIFYVKKSNSADPTAQDSKYDLGWDDPSQLLSYGSWSEEQMSYRSQPSVLYSDEEESKAREEKKAMLQYEIMRRKQQLEETARLKQELFKLARARQGDSRSCGDIPRQSRSVSLPTRPLPVGIIKPIEDKPNILYDLEGESEERPRDHFQKRGREVSKDKSPENEMSIEFRDDLLESLILCGEGIHQPEHSHFQSSSLDSEPHSNYSSTEYLAHKQESVLRQYMDESSLYGSDEWISEDYALDGGLVSVPSYSQPALNTLIGSSHSLAAARRAVMRRDPRIVSSVTLPNIFSSMEDGNLRPPYSRNHTTYGSTSISDTEGSPTSDVTPAMPLLDDVTAKSRTIMRNIGSGSRPVSAEFCAGDVEDMLNAMYRVESDNSVDADEPIMKHMTEGGVTILKQTDRKRRPAPVEPHRYNFPVKRILVTRDARDKSIKGNGLGMKIVGGKKAPGSKELGAYVTAIYPILADQLHGELDIGDQVLEWNGIHLTGLTSEEVQNVISQTNGEIEMVVRARMFPVSVRRLPPEPGGHISSYENLNMSAYDSLDLPSYRLSVKELPQQRLSAATVASRQGVDPRQLATELEVIKCSASPAESSPSSSQHDVPTPSVSSPSSTPKSEPTSTSSERQQRQASTAVISSGDRTDKDMERHSGEKHSERRRRGHSPNSSRSLQPHHSQRQSHQHQSSTPPHQQRPSQSKSCSPSRQPRQQYDTEVIPPEKHAPSRPTKEKKKQQERPVLPAISMPDRPHSAVSGSQTDKDPCPSPALNDRLRASPPLDTRRSVKSRGSRKGKDLFPSRSVQEVEKGEDYGLGEIQLQISHDDFDNMLNIHVIKARNLRPRDLNGLSDPFVKLYLLPGRGPENKRRTKHIARTLNPEWHQTVMFQDVARLELQNKVLELTVWDYDRFKTNDFLGELVIELKEFGFLDNKPHWYPLKEHVAIQSFELPKSSVPPPKPVENDKSKPTLARHGKKHGVSSLRPRESSEKDSEDSQRRKSLGALSVNGSDQATAVRQVSSATNSPLPSRRSLSSKSPIKTRSNGLLYR